MFFNPYFRRGIVARVLRPGILVLLALCFLAHAGSAFTAGPFSRTVDLLSPPASSPELIAAAASSLTPQDQCSPTWLAPEALSALSPTACAGGALLNPDSFQRPTAKAHTTPVLPRPPPVSLFS
jgi:hypothetical protein